MFSLIIRDLITNRTFEYPCVDVGSSFMHDRLIKDLYRIYDISKNNETFSWFDTPLCDYLPYGGLKIDSYRLVGFVDYGTTNGILFSICEKQLTYEKVLFNSEFIVDPEYIESLKMLHLCKTYKNDPFRPLRKLNVLR